MTNFLLLSDRLRNVIRKRTCHQDEVSFPSKLRGIGEGGSATSHESERLIERRKLFPEVDDLEIQSMASCRATMIVQRIYQSSCKTPALVCGIHRQHREMPAAAADLEADDCGESTRSIGIYDKDSSSRTRHAVRDILFARSVTEDEKILYAICNVDDANNLRDVSGYCISWGYQSHPPVNPARSRPRRT